MAVQCDVLVAGAGVAGVPAAVTAARRGLRTVIVEQNSFPGGTGVAGLHRFICGLYANTPEEPRFLHDRGIVLEICSLLEGPSGPESAVRLGDEHVLPFSPAQLQEVYTRLIEAEDDLESFFNSTVTSVIRDENAITTVVFDCMGKVVEVEPRVVIDCTGGGVTLRLADIPHRESDPRRCQLAGFTARFSGLVDVDAMLSIAVPYRLAEGVRRGTLPAHLQFTTFTPGAEVGEGFCKLAIPPFPAEARLERAKADADRVYSFLSASLPSFRNSRISETSPYVLDREGPRLMGKYELTEDDVVSGKRFSDGAVKNGWPIEFWDQTNGPRFRRLAPEREYYDIPVGCMKSRHVQNLLCAGRCISVSQRALGSTRVMGTCMALGEATGLVAAEMT